MDRREQEGNNRKYSRIVKYAVLVTLTVASILALCSCNNQNQEEESTTKSESEIVAVKAGSINVYLDEVKYYAYKSQATYEVYYMAEEQTINWGSELSKGVTMQEGVKSNVLDNICRREVFFMLADEYNIKLSDNDRKVIENAVNEYLNTSNEKLKKKIGISKKRLMEVFEKEHVARKIEEKLDIEKDGNADELYNKWKKENNVKAGEEWENITFDTPIFTLEDLN